MFFSIFTLILTKALPKWVFFSILALILTKAIPKGCFSLFCSYSHQTLPSMLFFLYFALILPTLKGFSLFLPLFLPYLTKKDVFLYFSPYLKRSPKWVLFSNFALILTKPYKKGCFSFSFFGFNPNKSTSKSFFFYFCSDPNKSPATKGVLLIIALTLTKALPQNV